MSQINDRIEEIFSHAVALQQDGRFRNTIYCSGKMIYIINQDMTVLLRFPIRTFETEFEHPICFFANDYDSKSFEERNGKICFIQENSDYRRVKSCRVPPAKSMNPKDIFNSLPLEKDKNRVRIRRSILNLLEEDLSHIEFSCSGGVLSVVQRNIFSGSIIEVRKRDAKGLLIERDRTEDFPTIALRTNDFSALFSFVDEIDFCFSNNGYVYLKSVAHKIRMDGAVSQCIYDEMGGYKNADRRKKQEKRGRK